MERLTIRKKILVTGGAGFIGSHVTELLCDKGFDVIVLDDLSYGFRHFVDKRARFVEGSLENRELLEDVLEGVSAVMHLAASSIISFSYQRPLEYFQNNVMNGIVLLEAMRKKGVKKIVNSSTAAVYGEQKEIPIKEEALANPLNPYGGSKLAFEGILRSYFHSFGIESVSLRYFNAFGPRDEQNPATRAVPIWIKALLEEREIPLYWNGEQFRDYVFVTDIAFAHFQVLSMPGIHVYNIGCGKGVLMKDILSMLEIVSQQKVRVKNMGERKGDPQRLIADISKIRKEIGWRPRTSLQDGLKKTYEYYASVYSPKL